METALEVKCLIFIVAASGLSGLGLYFTMHGQWHESAMTWNAATIVLWAFAASKTLLQLMRT